MTELLTEVWKTALTSTYS